MANKVNLKDAREKILEAIDTLADAVANTMGPGGQNVLLETQAGMPIITKDGVTVAKSIELEDSELNLVARTIREAADQTNREAGDGTTTSTVLAREIFKSGLKLVAAGENVSVLKKQIIDARNLIVAYLNESKSEIPKESRRKILKHIAQISLNGEEEIADMIASAIDQTGIHGLVTVQENTTYKDEMERVQGLEINTGWVSPFFTKKRDQEKIILEDCYVFITSHRLQNSGQLGLIENALKPLIKAGKPLLVIASTVSDSFLVNLIANNKQGQLHNCAIRPPYFGNVRKEFFTDLATMTGATVIEADKGDKLESVTFDHLGFAKRVEVGALKTVIIDGGGDPEQIKDRALQLEEKANEIELDKDLDKVHERLAKLKQGITLIKVRRESQIESEERKHRIEDAINACKAALEEGYVPGGGAALAQAKGKLDKSIPGHLVMREAISSPISQIAQNAGNRSQVALAKAELEPGKAYDAMSDKMVDPLESGIIDPVKVTKSALFNAVSVASTLLTTNVVVSRIPEDQPQMPFQMY
jgi:chaperonin GroEL